MKKEMMNKILRYVLILVVILFTTDTLMAQTPVPIGPQIATYNDTRVRGYHFTATSNWALCGLYIPTDNSTGMQHVEFVRFTQGPPPAFAGTTNNFVSLFYANNVAGTNMIPVPNVPVVNGNIYGTYGARSNVNIPTQMMNSYGATATITNVNGINMTLLRSGMQFPLNNQQMHDIWSEVNFNIGRIIMYYDCCPTPPSPNFQQAQQQICATGSFEYEIDMSIYSNAGWQIQSVGWNPGQSGTIDSANLDSSKVWISFNGNLVYDTICVAVTDTCRTSDSTCIPVVINPSSADAGPDTTICVDELKLNANQGVGVWSVVAGTGVFANPNSADSTVSGLTPGIVNTLRWTLSNANCPTVFDDVDITVNPIPISLFTAPDGCAQAPLQLTSTSYALGGSLVGYEWDVDGDGTIDYTQPSITHVYPTAGIKQCTLIVTADFGCKDTLIQPIEVFPVPGTDWNYAPDCEGSPMAFNDASTIGTGSVVQWFWDFGDGFTSTAQSPAHTYAVDSMYYVSMTATSDKGCQATKADSVEVFSVPEVLFTAPNRCWNKTVQFSDSSLSTQGTINYWEWDFGDGSATVQSQHTSYQYGAAAGIYNVRLTVATDKGCTNSVVKPINIYPVPFPNFTTEGVCEGYRIEFTDSSILDTVFGSELVSWKYDFGDGTILNEKQPGHFFDEPGIYEVEYTPETNYGCKQSTIENVLIRPTPQANILILDDQVCADNRVQFRDETYFDYEFDTTGVVDWYWNFGDGNTSGKKHPSNLYKKGGTYEVLLAVETQFGCADSAFKNAVMYHNPTAEFTRDTLEGCSPFCVVFIDKSRVGSGEDLIYNWRFGDGFRDDNVNPTYCYEIEDGDGFETFTPSLVVATQYGCTDTTIAREPVKVHRQPIANFTMQSRTLDFIEPIVRLENVSVGGSFFDWDFGDGATSIDANPIRHEYDAPGIYYVSLYTQSSYGCEDEITKDVVVERHQTIYIPTGFSPNGDGLNDVFSIEGEDLNDVRLWIFDRWGNELYYGENANAQWDGRVNGEMSPIGSYGYVLEYRKTDGIRQKERGTFFITKTNSKQK